MKKKRLMFLCHGNICRSPMAEYIMKDILRKAGREEEFEVSSGAVSDEEWGNPIYPPALRKMQQKGIPSGHHSAHKISPEEFASMDMVVVMDRSNLRWLARIVGESAMEGKVHMLMEFAGSPRDVADPWYTGDFETAFNDILAGCRGLEATL